jgi:thioredoxin:protein disulfide reductase
MMKKHLVTVSLFLFASVFSIAAQPVDTNFLWTLEPQALEIEQGKTGFLAAVLTVKEDHIVYKSMTSFAVTGVDGLALGAFEYPTAHEKEDPTDGEVKEVYDGITTFRIPIQATVAIAPGSYDVTVQVKYQGCSKIICFFPQTKTFPVTVNVIAASGENDSDQNEPVLAAVSSSSGTLDMNERISQGGLLTFLLVFFLGFLTSLTPCVYPLIPVTISIFGARETENRFQAFTLALTYVLGIAVMYSFLGYLAASTHTVFGAFMGNPWVMGLIALFFTALGISMLGVYEFRLPSGLQNKLSTVGGKGYGSAFLMGLVLGVVAAPCTGPILAGILAHTATTGNVTYGVSLMFVYSMGLGLLFLVIGTYSNVLANLPKSGGWMEGVKSAFAVIMFAAALYYMKDAFPFLRSFLSKSLALYGWVLIMMALGVALGAFHLSIHGSLVQKIRKISGVVLCTVAVYLFAGSFTVVEKSAVQWVYSLEEGLALAKEENKPVMIDFYADWCTICKELDALTYSKPEVGEALERFVNIKVDYEGEDINKEELNQTYRILGLPLIVFFDSGGNERKDKRIEGFMGAEKFMAHIKDIQ